MKIFLDEMLNGSQQFFQILGYETHCAKDQRLGGTTDLQVVEHVRDNDYDLFITKDGRAYELALLADVSAILVTNSLIAKAVHRLIQSSASKESDEKLGDPPSP